MIKPRALTPGSTVGLVAPASPVKREFVGAGIAELERLGLSVKPGEHLYARARYTAGSADQRYHDFVTLWDDPDVAALFCARGGYGTMDFLDRLVSDGSRFRDNPKIVLGASDVTALLSSLGARAELVTFHGPMVAQRIARGAFEADALMKLLSSREPYGKLDAPGLEVLHDGAAEGILWGGCLSMVVALVGTPHLPAFEDAVLFLEDTHVKPYQIDRMLTQLELSGRLATVRALVFGQMVECDQHPDQGYTLQEMLRDRTEELGVPVLYGFPSGHTRTSAWPLPLGVRVRVDGDGVHVLEGAVA